MNQQTKQPKRGRGRPRQEVGEENGVVTRDAIIDLAYEQARTLPLEEVTFVQLAKVLGVVPGSLHYHLGTKDDLNSTILNRFYKNLLVKLGEVPDDIGWRERIRRFAWILTICWREHRGAAEHIQTKARFRLFQRVGPGEVDYGAAYLNWVFTMFEQAGFDPEQTAKFYHVLSLHCLAAANSANARLEPAAHEAFLLERAASFPAGTMPGLDYALPAFAGIKADDAFELGLEALLDRFAAARH